MRWGSHAHRYAELASTRFINGVALAQEPYTNRLPATSVVYSEARKLFTSSKASYVKIEKYADLYGTSSRNRVCAASWTIQGTHPGAHSAIILP